VVVKLLVTTLSDTPNLAVRILRYVEVLKGIQISLSPYQEASE
jgi:hypothetical protein